MSDPKFGSHGSPLPFVLLSTAAGPMILNRLDQHALDADSGFGVAWELLNHGSYAKDYGEFLQNILHTRRECFGDGVIAVDCGAHIGMFAVHWARLMSEWGFVIGIEAQERLFYALAGNLTLNNCFNAKAVWGVVGGYNGVARVPVPNYMVESSFASLEIQRRQHGQWIGQTISYNYEATQPVQQLTIDALKLERADLIKIDVEGMEVHALSGAAETISRCAPIFFIDTSKADLPVVLDRLTSEGYQCHDLGNRLLAIHRDDPTLKVLGVKQEVSDL